MSSPPRREHPGLRRACLGGPQPWDTRARTLEQVAGVQVQAWVLLVTGKARPVRSLT